MNFVALIGIIERLKNVEEKIVTAEIKVEKPYVETSDEDWFEIINVQLDKEQFQKEIDEIKTGDVVGIKGRAIVINNMTNLIGERLQVF